MPTHKKCHHQWEIVPLIIGHLFFGYVFRCERCGREVR